LVSAADAERIAVSEVEKMGMVDWVARIVAFFRAGYPTRMPATGYVPLAALLPQRLCDDELTAVARELVSGHETGTISTVDVGVAISRMTDELPSPDDVAGVTQRLDAFGCARR
jgi:hypothetical protein